MTLRILIIALTLTAIHAQESPASGVCSPPTCSPVVETYPVTGREALDYQTARANALEAENAALKLQVKSLELQVVQSQAMVNKLTADWPNAKQLEAAQATAQKALDAARNTLKKSCGDKWDEVKSTCGK